MTRRTFGTARKLPSGRWQARYVTPDGERLTAPTTYASKSDALRWLSTIETDLHRGEWNDPRLAAISFHEVARQWLELKRARVRPATASNYEYLLDSHVLPHLGSLDIGAISPATVHTWLARLHANPRLGPNTIAKAYRVLNGVFAFAIDARLIQRSPCTINGAGTDQHTETRFATPEQVAELARVVDVRWQPLILTAAYSGLRWGELAGLRVHCVDLAARRLSVNRQLTSVNGHLSFGPPKTRAGSRTVTIPPFVAAALEDHLRTLADRSPDALVFVAPDGGPLRRENFRRRVWLPATRAAGLDGLRFHDLRHTGATLAAASGAPLRALMARLGHNSAAAALRYQHVLDDEDTTIADYVEELGAHHSRPSLAKKLRKPPLQKGTRRARRLTSPNDQDPPRRPDQDLLSWARRDSNSRPPPCKGGALAS